MQVQIDILVVMVLIVETGISQMELNCHSPHRLLISSVNTYEAHVSQRVDIRRNSSANSPTGIYRCGGTRMRMVFMELTCHYHEINV